MATEQRADWIRADGDDVWLDAFLVSGNSTPVGAMNSLQAHVAPPPRVRAPAQTVVTHLAISLASLAWLYAGACDAPTGPDSALAGTWRTAPIPSGSGVDFLLATSGAVVHGSGQEHHLHYLEDTFTVRGRQLEDDCFQLRLTFRRGAVGTYNGRMVGSDELDGTWTVGGEQPYRLRFYRQ